ncbi:MAG: hypothetical protein C0402_05695 [Thermodesulfovibrio sp.]|nr:hypothetical protein [Thermodesulfovibrio sp.]
MSACNIGTDRKAEKTLPATPYSHIMEPASLLSDSAHSYVSVYVIDNQIMLHCRVFEVFLSARGNGRNFQNQ